MSKCVKMLNGKYKDKVIRIPDDYAFDLVHEGRAEYAPKEAWKETGRENVKGVA